ncbi:UDP-N-acetylglucosamine 2-epimerase [Candidatus Saccharibacteria bacterium]|nr:MAG: UDP-N-acetylglucosamine 2-epimerase [Candidatus Saccharibacteria bacterium]
MDYFTPEAIKKIAQSEKKLVHIVLIATKPDIIKQAPLYHELMNRGELVLLCHTGQHYDFRYSGGMMEEFGITPDILLTIQGPLNAKIAQMIERYGEVIEWLKTQGKTPIPYIHGDTSTSMAIGLGSYMHRVACVHVEAGIRTLTPKREIYKQFYDDFKAGNFNWNDYYAAQQVRGNFEQGSMEPFPEQFNTRVSEPASGYHAAPVELDRDFMLAEGFSSNTIEVTGNTVADATRLAIADAAQSTILEKYPQLASGEFIRFCIHRRENTQDERRFTVLIEAMEKLVQKGRSVLLISLFGTEEAIDSFGLRTRIESLAKENPETFIYSDVWPYYRDVIAAMQRCAAVATDSGSMQEEMNILGVPCVTLRFGSDRSESVLAGANVQAPPIDSDFVVAIIEGALHNKQMASVGNLYGENVSAKIVDGVLARASNELGLFQTEEARPGLLD